MKMKCKFIYLGCAVYIEFFAFNIIKHIPLCQEQFYQPINLLLVGGLETPSHSVREISSIMISTILTWHDENIGWLVVQMDGRIDGWICFWSSQHPMDHNEPHTLYTNNISKTSRLLQFVNDCNNMQ